MRDKQKQDMAEAIKSVAWCYDSLLGAVRNGFDSSIVLSAATNARIAAEDLEKAIAIIVSQEAVSIAKGGAK